MVERFLAVKEKVERMEASLKETENPDREQLIGQLRDILENL